MGDEQRQALARLMAEDEGFRAAMMAATSVEDAVRIAGEHGIEATVDEVRLPDGSLAEAELEAASGGTVGTAVFTNAGCPTAPGWC